MRTFFLATVVCFAASGVWAGMSVPIPTPEPEPAPAVSEGSGDPTGALVLLALTAMVVFMGSTGGAVASQNRNDLNVNADDADDNAGF